MAVHQDGINIGTISGGIVNFGGAVYISPISITKETAGSGGSNSGAQTTTNTGLSSTNQAKVSELLNIIKTML